MGVADLAKAVFEAEVAVFEAEDARTKKLVEVAVQAERDRCVLIAKSLAEKWEASAGAIRECGTRRPWLFGKPYVMPVAARDAATIMAAVKGLRVVAMLIREGSIPTK